MQITGRSKIIGSNSQNRVTIPIYIVEALHITKQDSVRWIVDSEDTEHITLEIIRKNKDLKE